MAFVRQSSRSNLTVDDPAQSLSHQIQDQIFASLANESDEQLSAKPLSTSDAVAEMMLFQDRLRIGDNRRQPVTSPPSAVSCHLAASEHEVNVWNAITCIRIACV